MSLKVTRKSFERPAGTLQLAFFDDSRLVVGRLIQGKLEPEDVLSILGEADVKTGLIEAGIELISQGSGSELPVAAARIVDLPADTRAHAFKIPALGSTIKEGELPDFSDLTVIFPVKAGDILITLESPPKTVLRLPTGKYRVLREWDGLDPGLFSGVNTSVSEKENAVVADMEGFAHRTIYGGVAVYPMENIPGVGELHGQIIKGTSLEVTGEIAAGSHLISEGDIHVKESIRGLTCALTGISRWIWW